MIRRATSCVGQARPRRARRPGCRGRGTPAASARSRSGHVALGGAQRVGDRRAERRRGARRRSTVTTSRCSPASSTSASGTGSTQRGSTTVTPMPCAPAARRLHPSSRTPDATAERPAAGTTLEQQSTRWARRGVGRPARQDVDRPPRRCRRGAPRAPTSITAPFGNRSAVGPSSTATASAQLLAQGRRVARRGHPHAGHDRRGSRGPTCRCATAPSLPVTPARSSTSVTACAVQRDVHAAAGRRRG